jgi:hypothetical protein
MVTTKPERATDIPFQQEVLSALAGSEHARRELVGRVVRSPTFVRTERLSTLLIYVCDMALKGREAELNEQRIGQAVFGRSQDYDSAVDGIVRSQASRLRRRLDLYFQQEGADEPVRIAIPRGGYVPVFEPQLASASADTAARATANPDPGSGTAEKPVDTKKSDRILRRWLPWVLCVALALTLMALWIHDRRPQLQASTAAASTHAFWSHIFSRNRPTLVVAADSGLVMFHNMSEEYLDLNDYLDGRYRAELSGPGRFSPAKGSRDWVINLAGRRYTSMVDLNAVLSLGERARTLQGEVQVRYARDLRPNDLKTGNVVLLGASEANPWVELFERNMNFVFHNDYRTNVFSVLNRTPRKGEPARWDSAWNDPLRRVYGLVAYVPNLAGDGNALILEGTSMSGTEAAWDFVADDARLLPFLKDIQRPDGTLPHFELLLGTQNMSASAVHSQILAWRVMN